jgi:hypothetical protein
MRRRPQGGRHSAEGGSSNCTTRVHRYLRHRAPAHEVVDRRGGQNRVAGCHSAAYRASAVLAPSTVR